MRLYREMRNWTQTQLGELLGGIKRQNISGMEKNTRPISKEIAKKLSQLFDVSVEKFI
jgi:transcriptional regulator with XRE-family HTH domain